MFPNVDALRSALVDRDPKSFVSHFIFEPIPFAFGSNLGAWVEWKTMLGEALDVDPKDIVMTGSACIGFSLNPHKGFKPFDEQSDFDCGVISGYHFDVAWRYLRQQRVSWLTLSQETKNAITSHRRQYIFSGTIAADKMLSLLPFGRTWQGALDRMKQVAPARNREVRLRIYKDFESLRHYQAMGIEKLRTQIMGSFTPETADDADEMVVGVDE